MDNTQEKKIKKSATLQGMIEVANKVISGEWGEEELNDYKESFIIKPYLSLMEKTIIIVNILNSHLLEEDSLTELAVAEMQVDLFFHGLLEGYGMVECSDTSLINISNYDLLFPLFYSDIIKYCKEDYDIFKEMYKDCINVSNIRQTIQALEAVDDENLDRVVSSTANMLNTFSNKKDIIEHLNNIMVYNDPATTSVVDSIKKSILESQINTIKNSQ